jgi:hypothetical protein
MNSKHGHGPHAAQSERPYAIATWKAVRIVHVDRAWTPAS